MSETPILQDRRTWLGLLAVAAASVAALPFLLSAEEPQLSLRRRQLAAMTQSQREHVQRNFARFEAMSEAERQQLETFSAVLEDDRLNNRSRLTSTLQVYGDWLQTITPHQRDALRKESDPARRIGLMREFVDEQREDRVEVRMGERSEALGPIPTISRSDLEAMLAVLSDKLGLYLSNRSELDEYEGMPRYLKMFELLAREKRSVREVLSDATSRQLLDAVTDEQTREALETVPDGERPLPRAMTRRFKLGRAIFQAIEVELDRELQQRRISKENLQTYFDNLPTNEQDELLGLTPTQFRQELLSRYVDTDWSENRINMRLVRQFFRPQRPEGRER